MDTGRKDANIQIGKRLREARLNMNLEKSEIADVLGVTVEHYRKLEAGITGISVDKVLTLYHKYGIDPTYLITGESSMKDFNLDYYVANSTKEQRNEFFDRVLAYLSKLIRCRILRNSSQKMSLGSLQDLHRGVVIVNILFICSMSIS